MSEVITPHTRAVVIGGGTGTSTVLRGLKQHGSVDITAIVTSFDDGGGTGQLRRDYAGSLPTGDFRQCIGALSDQGPELIDFFEHKFPEAHDAPEGSLRKILAGQTIGNLLIAFQAERNGGNYPSALEDIGKLLNISGRVLPVTHDDRRLIVTPPGSKPILGEHAIEETDIPSLLGSTISFDEPPPVISEETESAIESADFVVLAPGDLYTSVGPVLAVRGVSEAIRQKPVYLVTNIMNRNRHTKGYTPLTYAQEYERILGSDKEHIIRTVILNDRMPSEEVISRQRDPNSRPVEPNIEELRAAGYNTTARDLLSDEFFIAQKSDKIGASRSSIRHDSLKTARVIMGVHLLDVA